MRAVMLEVPPHLLEERRRTGEDRWDEMWEGVLHMVPPPSAAHQLIGGRLYDELKLRAEARGLMAAYEMGMYAAADDYRRPDLAVFREEHLSKRGLEGAELVVEIVSPGDEIRDKVPWYAARVSEVLLVDRDTLRVELFRCDGGTATATAVDPACSSVLGATFRRLDDNRLTIVTGDSAEVLTAIRPG
jgi:Uma2 family endonuclease